MKLQLLDHTTRRGPHYGSWAGDAWRGWARGPLCRSGRGRNPATPDCACCRHEPSPATTWAASIRSGRRPPGRRLVVPPVRCPNPENSTSRATSCVLHQRMPSTGLPATSQMRDPTPPWRRPADRTCERRPRPTPAAGKRRSGPRPTAVRREGGLTVRSVRPTRTRPPRPRRRVRVRRRLRLLLVSPTHGKPAPGTADDLPVASQSQELRGPARRQDPHLAGIRSQHSRRSPAWPPPAPAQIDQRFGSGPGDHGGDAAGGSSRCADPAISRRRRR